MKSHVKEKLSAYLNHQLPPTERQAVAAHLINCPGCRREHDRIKLGAALAGILKRADAPESNWSEIENSLRGRDAAQLQRTFFFSPRGMVAGFAALLVVAGLAAVGYFGLFRNAPPEIAGDKQVLPIEENVERAVDAPFWQVEAIAGAPRAGSRTISETGNLAVGDFLETDARSRARIAVADIGQVEIAPNSRVRLVKSQADEHRLSLERGVLQAQILAPPRLFIVDTPSAAAVDLGCEYTLQVNGAGDSKLHVTSGFVALERDGRESIVPAGAFCLTRRGKGVGTPFFGDASPALRAALLKFDFAGGGRASLQTIVKESRARDTLTLWHLLSRVPADEREKVFDALAAYVKIPAGVTREGVLKLDRRMLDEWRAEIEESWFE